MNIPENISERSKRLLSSRNIRWIDMVLIASTTLQGEIAILNLKIDVMKLGGVCTEDDFYKVKMEIESLLSEYKTITDFIAKQF